MKVLLADDEMGIREGMATFLRLKGVEVRTAGRCDEALALLAEQPFDAVLTDWHLEDGVAAPLLECSTVPVLVVSGYPEEVTTGPNLARVLPKPVAPAAMLEQLAACVAEPCPNPAEPRPEPTVPALAAGGCDPLATLPEDARRRMELVLDWCGGADAAVEITDEGPISTLRVTWPSDSDPLAAVSPPLEQLLEWLGGDLRVLRTGGRPRLEYRVRRDGAPAAGAAAVDCEGPWPEGPCSIDFEGLRISPARFLSLLDEVARRGPDQGPVHLCNVPPRLRLLAEASGHGARLPKREPVGPLLPAVLTALWS